MRVIFPTTAKSLCFAAILGLCCAGLFTPVTSATSAQAVSVHQGAALFTLVNNTSQQLALYIDGQHCLSVSSRHSGIVSVTTGYHTFEAVMLDGTNRHVTRSGEIDATGRTWTVDEG